MRIIFLLGIIVLLSRCNTKSSSSLSGFDKIFDSVFTANEPGGAVLIAKDGKVIYKKGFGIEDINTKKAIDTKTLFNVGSISKTFVAFGILQLANENKLSLDDDLYKYFPDFKNSSIAKKNKDPSFADAYFWFTRYKKGTGRQCVLFNRKRRGKLGANQRSRQSRI